MPREPVVIAYGVEAEVAQPVAGGARGGAHLGEAAAGGIEVERQTIGLVGLVGAGQPGVHGDHVLSGQVHERRGVLGQHVGDRPALLAARVTRLTQAGK